MKELTPAEIKMISGGFMGAIPSGAMSGAGQIAGSTGTCDYHHMQERAYCFNDAIGPDSFYWVD